MKTGTEFQQFLFFELLLRVRNVQPLTTPAHAIAFDGLDEDDRGCPLGFHCSLVGRIYLSAIVPTTTQASKLLIGIMLH